MTEMNTAEQLNTDTCEEEKHEENQKDSEVISIKAAKLLKLQHKLRALREEALSGYTEEMQDCKTAFVEANDLIGELHGITGGKQQSS